VLQELVNLYAVFDLYLPLDDEIGASYIEP
jgi:hypothetical protein